MQRPDEHRVFELIDIIKRGVEIDNRDLFEYTSWDDLIECAELLTYDEYQWCRQNLLVKVKVTVTEKDPPIRWGDGI